MPTTRKNAKKTTTTRTVPLPQTRAMELLDELRTATEGNAVAASLVDELEKILKTTDLREWRLDPSKRAKRTRTPEPI